MIENRLQCKDQHLIETFGELKMYIFNEVLSVVEKQLSPLTLMKGGSRLFGDHSESSDWDVYVLVENLNKSIDLLCDLGYKNCGQNYEMGDDDIIYIARKGDINVMITSCHDKFDLWNRCNKVAETLKLSKEDRSTLFSLINN